VKGKQDITVSTLSQMFGVRGARALLIFACALCLSAAVRAAQNPAPADDPTPPPKIYVPEEVRQQLSASKDAKARTKLSLTLSEERLQRAATHTSAEQYEAAGRELGIYQAIVEDAIRHIQNHVKKDGQRRDLFKRMELTLRAHMPRIETLRRMTPSEDAVHIRGCMDFVRDARVEALNSFYDDTVIRVPTRKNESPLKEGNNPQGTSLDAPEKKP
jgi:hypothetical protein